MPRYFLALVLILIVFISSCKSGPAVVINNKKVAVEVADNPSERALGLMNRQSLNDGSGMLFIFEDDGLYSFWMKNTLIPLDMIFISKDFGIVDILEAEPCKDDPCAVYTPKGSAKYVLEVNQGYSRKNNINIGDKVALNI